MAGLPEMFQESASCPPPVSTKLLPSTNVSRTSTVFGSIVEISTVPNGPGAQPPVQ